MRSPAIGPANVRAWILSIIDCRVRSDTITNTMTFMHRDHATPCVSGLDCTSKNSDSGRNRVMPNSPFSMNPELNTPDLASVGKNSV